MMLFYSDYLLQKTNSVKNILFFFGQEC